MLSKLNKIITFFDKKLFPSHIYYNAEQCIIEDGVIVRLGKIYPDKPTKYEIHDIKPDEVKKEIDLYISLHSLNKVIMQKVLSSLKRNYERYKELEPEKLLFIENKELDGKHGFYLELVKKRKKELLNIYCQLEIRYSKTRKTSYVWQNNPENELPELYSLMIDKYKLIAPETTYEQFKAVFSEQPIDRINPIKWHQDNATELLYFICRLEQSNNIIHNPKRADYQRLAACFVQPDGKPFKAAWKSLKTNIDIGLSPDKQKAIDELVNNF